MKPPGSKIQRPNPNSELSPMHQGKALPGMSSASEPQFVSAIGSIMSAFADIGYGLTPSQQTPVENPRTENLAVQAFEFQRGTSQSPLNRGNK